MRDLYNNSTVKILLAAKRRSTGTGAAAATLVVETGTAVDLVGEGRKCLLLVSVGATATVTMTITIQESSDNSNWTTLGDVLDYDHAGTEIVDLTPTKRYIRAIETHSATAAITVSYIDAAVGIVVYNERYRPSNVA